MNPGDPAPPCGDPERDAAREVCLRLLAARPRSRAELASRLRDKGFDADVAERVLDRMVEVQLVDDAAFAHTWVRSRHMTSGRGRHALAHELREKGISPEHAAAALAHLGHDQEEQRARELVRRRLMRQPGSARPVTAESLMRSVTGMLARRGYPAELIFAVVRAELAAATAATSEFGDAN